MTPELKQKTQEFNSSNAIAIMETKLTYIESTILDITINTINTTQQFNNNHKNTTSKIRHIKINPDDPIILMFKSLLSNSSFLYKSNSNLVHDDFRIDNRTLLNFFYNINLIHDGENQQYDFSEDFDSYMSFLEDYKIIKNKEVFIEYLLF